MMKTSRKLLAISISCCFFSIAISERVIAGTVVDSFDSPCMHPNGLAFDGTYLWIADHVYKIYRITTSGTVVDSFDSPDHPGFYPSGLAFDGTYLWIASRENTDTIFKITTSGTVVDSFDGPGYNPSGLAFDGTYLWIASHKTDKIYKIAITPISSSTTSGPTTTTTISSTSTTTISQTTTSTTINFPEDGCSSELIYGRHSEETKLLRYFRDQVLNKTPAGQEIIELYYQWSPAIVKAMEGDKEFEEEVKEMIDGVLPMIRNQIE